MKRITYNGQELYQRRFNTGDDLKGKPHTLTITKIEPVTVFTQKGEEHKYAIHFEKASRPFILGKQFAESIGKALGEYDAAKWIGKTITIYPVPTASGNGNAIFARKPEPKPAKPTDREPNPNGAPLTPEQEITPPKA